MRRRCRHRLQTVALLGLVVTLGLAAAAQAQMLVLERAQNRLASGQHAEAAELARSVALDTSRSSPDRAEAYRVLGLAQYFLGNRAAAKEAFLWYVRLEPEAHLDPALVPPEAIIVLEEVRAERAAELTAARDKPKIKPALNLLPPFGQLQNRQQGKGIVIGGLWVSLLAANVTSWLILKSWCEDDGTCPGHQGSADSLRTFNLVTGPAAALVYIYGVVDGYVVMRRNQRSDQRISLSLGAGRDGAQVFLQGRF